MIKRYSLVFIASFFLNLIWENLHSFLYLSYKGGPITEFILLRATLFDAIFITLLWVLIDRLPDKGIKMPVLVGVSFLVAVLIEVFALSTGRWAYGSCMPIIPVLEVGLSPIIQLPLLMYVVEIISRILTKHKIML